jgi:hypothetical protein
MMMQKGFHRHGFPCTFDFSSYFEWNSEESWKIQWDLLCGFR